MCELSYLSCGTALLLLSGASAAGLLNYYQTPMEHRTLSDVRQTPLEQEGPADYALYLKPVLVHRSSPVDPMYLTMDGKDIFLYPSAFHMAPQHRHTYPLQAVDERLAHHVENPREYMYDPDGNYSGSEEQPQHRGASNSTATKGKIPQNKGANHTRVTSQSQDTE